MDLYEQLQGMLAAANVTKDPDKRFFNVSDGVVCGYYINDLIAISKHNGARLHADSHRRYITYHTRANGIRVEVPIVRPVPLEHTCPPDCYRIHLTTPDPEGAAV